MTQKKKVVNKKHNAIKKIAMSCPMCRYKPFPKRIDMEEELVNGVVTGYSCPECAHHIDCE